ACSVRVHFPAVVNHGHLAGQTLLTVDAGKFLRRRYDIPVDRHNDITRLHPELACDAARRDRLDQNSATRVRGETAGDFRDLALILLDRIHDLTPGTHRPGTH